MRHAERREENEKEIVRELRIRGASVHQIDDTDCPDLLVGYKGKNYLLEVIGGAKFKKYRQDDGLSPGQAEWHLKWKGSARVVRSAYAAVLAIGAEW